MWSRCQDAGMFCVFGLSRSRFGSSPMMTPYGTPLFSPPTRSKSYPVSVRNWKRVPSIWAGLDVAGLVRVGVRERGGDTADRRIAEAPASLHLQRRVVGLPTVQVGGDAIEARLHLSLVDGNVGPRTAATGPRVGAAVRVEIHRQQAVTILRADEVGAEGQAIDHLTLHTDRERVGEGRATELVVDRRAGVEDLSTGLLLLQQGRQRVAQGVEITDPVCPGRSR